MEMKKVFIGWIYDEPIKFETLECMGDVEGATFTLLKRKKSLGNFKGLKAKITVEEL